MIDLPEDPDDVFLEIGGPGQPIPDIEKAALAFVLGLSRYPEAVFHLCVSGFDADEREVWEIPEARALYRVFAEAVRVRMFPGFHIEDLHLDDASAGCLAMCLGIATATRDPATQTWNIEINLG